MEILTTDFRRFPILNDKFSNLGGEFVKICGDYAQIFLISYSLKMSEAKVFNILDIVLASSTLGFSLFLDEHPKSAKCGDTTKVYSKCHRKKKPYWIQFHSQQKIYKITNGIATSKDFYWVSKSCHDFIRHFLILQTCLFSMKTNAKFRYEIQRQNLSYRTEKCLLFNQSTHSSVVEIRDCRARLFRCHIDATRW